VNCQQGEEKDRFNGLNLLRVKTKKPQLAVIPVAGKMKGLFLQPSSHSSDSSDSSLLQGLYLYWKGSDCSRVSISCTMEEKSHLRGAKGLLP